jgi:microsomal dipeptidase-like Zn-dependent dipeptidase
MPEKHPLPAAIVLASLFVAFLAVQAAAAEAMPAAGNIYQYAGECVTLRDNLSHGYLVRDWFGYSVQLLTGGGTPLRMQATGLGSYLLYAPDGGMPAAGGLGGVFPIQQPGAKADWLLSGDNAALQLTNVSSGLNLSVTWWGGLNQSPWPSARWSIERANGCATFPEVEVNVEGNPESWPQRGGAVRGFLDAHVHITAFEFIGGRFHCGRPWSRYGVTEALKDCPDHFPDGRFAIAENLLSHGTLFATHSIKGWPDFDGWPRYYSLTHEGTYWKGVERAWRGGLRVLVADLVENRALCEIYWLKQNPCTDMESLRLQARDLYDLQDYIDAQFKGPGKGFFRIVKSPAEARAAINAGKLAVVMGVETSQPFDCLYRDGVEQCSHEQIDSGLQEMWDFGVRSLFPVHKFDNAFGGTTMDGGATGILVNIGNFWATGRWWQVEPCSTSESDHSPAGPAGPTCNVRGLTDLGEYLVNRMIDRGMIVETDHLSVKGRGRVLDILESRNYSGVITSHSWGDDTSRVRIQALGGIVSPYANTATTFIREWQNARSTQSPSFLWGIGFGTDTNGLGAQASPRPGATTNNPVTYPFTSFDGHATIHQSQWGNRLWNLNLDGASHYGLYSDWTEDLRLVAGQEIVDDLARGAEAYLQMWERAFIKTP